MDFSAFKVAVKTLEESSVAFLPLRSASRDLLSLMDTLQQTDLIEVDYFCLIKKIEDIITIIDRHKTEPMSSRLRQHLNDFGRLISQEINCGTGDSLERIASIIEYFQIEPRDIRRTLKHDTINIVSGDQYNNNTTIYCAGTSRNANILSHPLFNNLSHVAKASYNASMPAQRRGCTENTRMAILTKLWEWVSDPLQPKVYWMKGMAGTGKTAIAYSLSLKLEHKNMLGATFFCSRLVDECAKVDRIFPTIAHGLARNYPPLASSIMTVLEKFPDVGHRTLNLQFTNLIANPTIASVAELTRYPRPIVIVIDALDECENQKDVQALLSIIFNRSRQLPFKIFITSRPEQAIRMGFNMRRPESYSEFILHEVEPNIVKEDIKLYLAERFAEMVEGRSDFNGSRRDWPPAEKIDLLATRASGLFIFAKTVCDHIGGRGGNILEHLIEATSKEADARNWVSNDALETNELDGLYRGMLERAVPLRRRDYERQKVVLSAVITIRNPLSAEGLSTLLKIAPGAIKSSLASLHSVISVPRSIYAPVSTFHASFPDFLTNPNRSREHFLSSFKSHRLLATSCLLLMNSCLRENICGLDGRPANDEIAMDTIKAHISEGLGYACLFWASHLTMLRNDDVQHPDNIFGILNEFLREHVLHWMECLSLLQHLNTAIKSLRTLERWVHGLYPELLGMVMDARRFIMENFDVIRQHCLETYYSALVWLPTQSFIRERWGTQRDLPKVIIGLRESRDACENVIRCPAGLSSVALSSDGSRVVYVSGVVVQVCDSATGDVELTLEGHVQPIRAVAISSDDSLIASGSDDQTVRIWSAVTGEELRVLEGHSDAVNSVAFSNDSSCIAIGRVYWMVRMWKKLSGGSERGLKERSQAVVPVVFSGDGNRIASGSSDKTIRIHDVLTGKLKGVLTEDAVISMASSNDTSHVVIGSVNEAIQIQNVLTGKLVQVLRGHSGLVHSAAISSDGDRLASGSSDKTIRIWDLLTGQSEYVLMGHSNVVTSVAFSSDGSSVASGSNDNTIRIWNVTGHSERARAGYLYRERPAAISNDGVHHVAIKKAVKLWNVLTGFSKRVPEGHSDHIECVTFSSDGSRVASGSRDQTVRIWNVSTGFLERVLKGHSDGIHAVAFSNDGSRVVSGSYDGTVQIWKTATGKLQRMLNGNSGPVALPDGSVFLYDCDGRFRVLSSVRDLVIGKPTRSNFLDGTWIHSNSAPRCWIPPQYRRSSNANFRGSMVSFGLANGQVLVLDLSPAFIPGS